MSSASLFLALKDFLLERVGLGEVEGDLVGGDLVVDLSHGVDLVLNLLFVEGVQEDFDVLLAIEGDSGALASDGSWVSLLNIIINNKYYDIFQDSCIDSGQSSASGSLLSSVSLGYRHGLDMAENFKQRARLLITPYLSWK
jgi:hypothetical protein